jgi:TRAP-type C4-dicarboxylate transport system permease small subunit
MLATTHKLFYRMAWLMAVVGGAVLTLLVLMICTSILGRVATDILHSAWAQGAMPGLANWLIGIGIGPIYGDYEFIVAGMAFTVFCFIGWCQITGGHATVDVFTTGLGDRTRRWLQMVIEIVFAAVLVLIAVQLYVGMSSYMRRGSTTFMLQYPLWWNYAAALVPAVITALIGVYMAFVRIAEAVLNRHLVTTHGADH